MEQPTRIPIAPDAQQHIKQLAAELMTAHVAFTMAIDLQRSLLNVPKGKDWTISDDGSAFVKLCRTCGIGVDDDNDGNCAVCTSPAYKQRAHVQGNKICQREHCTDPGDVTGS